MQAFLLICLTLGYLAALSALAAFVDRRKPLWLKGRLRAGAYALGLGVYCTSWAFFGSVGYAAQAGWSYLALALGPILLLTAFGSVLGRVVRISHELNIASVADFIGARYGKSERVAALVACVAILGSTLYVAIQIRAIDMAATSLLGPGAQGPTEVISACLMTLFALLFGVRRGPATERQDGLSVAVAVEALIKLAAVLLVLCGVVYGVFGGFLPLVEKAAEAGVAAPFEAAPDASRWLALTLLSGLTFLLLPRVFHMAVVENRDEADVAVARRVVPLYLAVMSLFAGPIALAGLATFGGQPAHPAGVFALTVPLQAGSLWLATVAFLAAVSAGAVVVIVECVAISVMASNDIVVPLMLRGRSARRADMTRRLLGTRAAAIVATTLAALVLSRAINADTLTIAPAIAMTAIAQLGPAFFGGLVWRRANARGAIAGVVLGLAVWCWLIVYPVVAQGPSALFAGGTGAWPLGDPLVEAILLSLVLNAAGFVLGSLSRAATTVERQQALLFCDGVSERRIAPGDDPVPPPPAIARGWRTRATAGELVQTVARYLGPERTETAFRGFAIARGGKLKAGSEIDLQTLRFAEHLLASAIGAASSRLVLSMLLTRRNVSPNDALRLLDHASAAMQTSRDVLQNALDHARQGVTAIDGNMKLVCWNRQFRELFDLPEEMIHFGVGLDDIFRFNAERGLYGPVNADEFIKDRIERFVVRLETLRTRLHPSGRVIEIRSARMPDGGVVTTYTDISDTVAAQEALERANETLERRVRERTRELTRLNQELARAKTEADEANISKTRFLAAASHDILQPLNAARLFATSLAERATDRPDQAGLARNIETSLDGVEEILSTLLDISRLDTGAMRPEISSFRLDDITDQLAREFAPVAEEKGLKLVVLPTSVTVRSDRRLLRRVLQNLVSNAIKYTPSGSVLVGCRRLKGRVRIEVWDTGLGIAEQQQKVVFREFKRLEQGARVAPGLGLGLSIVERIARVLEHPVTLRSRPGKGSIFAVEAPISAALPAARPSVAHNAAPNQALAGLTVLAIDNEPKILEGMTTLLTGWGCEVIAAPTQKDAELEAVRRKIIPDVMLADYHLDDTDGLETITALRWKFGKPIPAVLITADRSPQLRAEADGKRVMMLPKPIRPAALRALLSQMMSVRTAAE